MTLFEFFSDFYWTDIVRDLSKSTVQTIQIDAERFSIGSTLFWKGKFAFETNLDRKIALKAPKNCNSNGNLSKLLRQIKEKSKNFFKFSLRRVDCTLFVFLPTRSYKEHSKLVQPESLINNIVSQKKEFPQIRKKTLLNNHPK